MNKKNNKSNIFLYVIAAILIISFLRDCNFENNINIENIIYDNTFKIISTTSTKSMDEEIISYGKKNNINIEIEHHGDLEIVDILNNNSREYDAVWISNSLWLYMLDNSYLTIDSKSIVIDPVVFGITKNKAEELGFVNKEVYNKDILNAIKDNKLKYIMSSVTKTNTGATSYLTFLNSLAGSPEILTENMLKDEKLINDLKNLFKGVERVSGDEEYLKTIFLKGNYNAMINYESTLININKELIKKKKEPLYLIYPKDGVAINDMPFAYINNEKTDESNKEKFLLIQSFLTSKNMQKKLEENGFRSWYGGINEKADSETFNKEWGIDTTKYLKDMKYPSKTVITKSFDLFIEALRKPTHVVFCLDVSGSMYGEGLKELKDAMNYILDNEEASKDRLQFSDKDKITIISFNEKYKVYDTKYGTETNEVIKNINELDAGGGTNIYDSSKEGLKILKNDSNDEYTKTVILMTDGYSNSGNYNNLRKYYETNKLNIPIYSITFGSSSESQLEMLAELSNGKVFNGKNGLKEAFTEVRSYN
ncbi:MAG: VWA domain-containing protein [Bacilli bacterium]|nr:VWA domain-containing protein [Bacilli bacterium]